MNSGYMAAPFKRLPSYGTQARSCSYATHPMVDSPRRAGASWRFVGPWYRGPSSMRQRRGAFWRACGLWIMISQMVS